MNHSGDAAEQIVRMSLEGIEVVARITGTAAKEVGAFIVAALKNKDGNLKLKGRARMTSMLKSGKPLEIFSVKDKDLQKFMLGAKQYGIVYCVLRNRKNKPDGMSDILVKADDAPKISRVVERFKFATVDKAKIENEIVRSKEEKAQSAQAQNVPPQNVQAQEGAGQPAPDKNDTEKLLDDLLIKKEGKTAQGKQPEVEKTEVSKTAPAKEPPPNPAKAKTEKPLPSAPTSESRSKSAEGTSSRKPSVRGELREMRAVRRAEKEADAPKREDRQARPKANPSIAHKQPQAGRKRKSKKSKER